MPWPSSAVNSGPRRFSQAHRITQTRRNSQPTCSTAFCSSPVGRPNLQSQAKHLLEISDDLRTGDNPTQDSKKVRATQASAPESKPNNAKTGSKTDLFNGGEVYLSKELRHSRPHYYDGQSMPDTTPFAPIVSDELAIHLFQVA